MSGHQNPFLGFAGHTKFFLMRFFGNSYLASQGGELVHNRRLQNQLTVQAVAVIQALLSFGFQSTLLKIQGLAPGIVGLLDGRNDPEDRTYNGLQLVSVPFVPLTKRYKVTAVSAEVTRAKVNAINILAGVSALRANFRLSKLLNVFKGLNGSDGHRELKRHQCYVLDGKASAKLLLSSFLPSFVFASSTLVPTLAVYTSRPLRTCTSFTHAPLNTQADRYQGFLSDKLFTEFEALFTSGDGARLDLDALSGEEVDTVLLDSLMYDDDALFAAALENLERTFTQRRKLLEAVAGVTLLHQDSVAVFGSATTMLSQFSYLAYCVRSCEVWGVSSKVSGPFGPAMYDTAMATLARTSDFLVAESLSFLDEPPPPRLIPVLSGKRATKKAAKGALAEQDGQRGESVDKAPTSVDDGASAAAVSVPKSVPNGAHQDVLRAMNLHATLIEALKIDYNLAFLGSICSGAEKVQSREYLVTTQRALVAVTIDFVKHNAKNQALLFKSLPLLRQQMGPLKLPPWPGPDLPPEQQLTAEQRAHVATGSGPGMDTEAVICRLVVCTPLNLEPCLRARVCP
jgi:hypothetical protein